MADAGAQASVSSSAPTLETARLRLRAHRADDHAALIAAWGDPAVYRYLSGKPTSAPDAWLRMLRYGGMWSLLGYGYWAVEDKASGTFIGDIGYADFRRGMTPSLDGMPELGWVLAGHAHGQGYGSEALAAVQAWGDAHFGAHRSCCIIDPQNEASLRLAAKAGFQFWQDGDLAGTSLKVFTRDV